MVFTGTIVWKGEVGLPPTKVSPVVVWEGTPNTSLRHSKRKGKRTMGDEVIGMISVSLETFYVLGRRGKGGLWGSFRGTSETYLGFDERQRRFREVIGPGRRARDGNREK